MHNPILLTAICAVVSFFIGAIPFGLILGRVFNHTDIRKAGSGNIGTTNALRVAGPKVAALTLLLDCLKGAICVLIARPLIASVGYGFPPSIMAPGAAGDWMLGVICLAAVWGHIFSPYLNFHGGKGIPLVVLRSVIKQLDLPQVQCIFHDAQCIVSFKSVLEHRNFAV